MEQQGTPRVVKKNFTLRTIQSRGHAWQFLETSDSATILIYITDRDQILLVRQRRDAMVCDDNPEGWITESMGGRFDREENVRELLAREASEEVGGTIDPSTIVLLNDGAPMALSAGCLVERAWLGYVEITSSQLENADREYGLAEEGERITRIFLPAREVESYVCEDVRVFALLQWFLRMNIDDRR